MFNSIKFTLLWSYVEIMELKSIAFRLMVILTAFNILTAVSF